MRAVEMEKKHTHNAGSCVISVVLALDMAWFQTHTIVLTTLSEKNSGVSF